MTKIVYNAKHGGFGLSEAAYEKIIEWGVPVRKYTAQNRDQETGLYDSPPENEGEVIFDLDLNDSADETEQRINKSMRTLAGRYWDDFLDENRTHPLLVRVVEELGDAASGRCAKLAIRDLPAGTRYIIDEYDGFESVRTPDDFDWRTA